MDKLRKIAKLFWYNKERLLLAALVCVLGWRVYDVFNPSETATVELPHLPPQRPTADDISSAAIPAPIAKRVEDNSFASIYKRNPFWYYSGQVKVETPSEEDRTPSISLLDIGNDRVRLQVGNNKKWCMKGAEFEGYKVRNIDSAAQTCEVYSAQSGRTETLRVEGR